MKKRKESPASASFGRQPLSGQDAAVAGTTSAPGRGRNRGITFSQALLTSTTAFVERGSIRLANARIHVIDDAPSLASTRAATKALLLGNNYIQSIQGLHRWVDLEALSVSHNSIKCLHDIDAIRHFRRLSKLNLEGNPVTELPFYRSYVLALCPSLAFLDNQKISNEERAICKADYQELVASIEAMKINQIRLIVLGNIRVARSLSMTIQVLSRRLTGRGLSQLHHPGSDSSSLSLPPFEFAKTLRICVKGGVFRMLLILNDGARFLDLEIQAQLRATYIREMAKLRPQHLASAQGRREFSRSALAMYSQRQLQSIMSILSDLPPPESEAGGGATASHIAAVESLLLPAFISANGAGTGTGKNELEAVYNGGDVQYNAYASKYGPRTVRSKSFSPSRGHHRIDPSDDEKSRDPSTISTSMAPHVTAGVSSLKEDLEDADPGLWDRTAGCGLGHGQLGPDRTHVRNLSRPTSTSTSTVAEANRNRNRNSPNSDRKASMDRRLCLDAVGGGTGGEELARKLPPKQVEPTDDSSDSLSDQDIEADFANSAANTNNGENEDEYEDKDKDGVRIPGRSHLDHRGISGGGGSSSVAKANGSVPSSSFLRERRDDGVGPDSNGSQGDGGRDFSISNNSSSSSSSSNNSNKSSSNLDNRRIIHGTEQPFDMAMLATAENREIDMFIRSELESASMQQQQQLEKVKGAGASSSSSSSSSGTSINPTLNLLGSAKTPALDVLLKIVQDIWKDDELPTVKSDSGSDVNMERYFGPSPYDTTGSLAVDLIDKGKGRSNAELINGSTSMKEMKEIVDQFHRVLASRRKDEYLCSKVNEYFWTLIGRMKLIIKSRVAESHKFLRRLQEQIAASSSVVEKFSPYVVDQHTLQRVYQEKFNRKQQLEADLDALCDVCSALQAGMKQEDEQRQYLVGAAVEVQNALDFLAVESTNNPALRRRLAYNRAIDKIVLLKYSYQFALLHECFVRLAINKGTSIKIAKFRVKTESKRHRRIAKLWMYRMRLFVHSNSKFLRNIDSRRYNGLKRQLFLKWRRFSINRRFFNQPHLRRRLPQDLPKWPDSKKIANRRHSDRSVTSNIGGGGRGGGSDGSVALNGLQRLWMSRVMRRWAAIATRGQHLERTGFVLRAMNRLRKSFYAWKGLHSGHRNRIKGLRMIGSVVETRRIKRGFINWISAIRFTRTQSTNNSMLLESKTTINCIKFHFIAWNKLFNVIRFQKKLFILRKFRSFKAFSALRRLIYEKRLRFKAASLAKWMSFRHMFRFWKNWRAAKAIALHETFNECVAIQTYLTSLLRLTFKAWKDHHRLQNKYYLDLITNREVRINIRDSLSPRNSSEGIFGVVSGSGDGANRDSNSDMLCDGEGEGAVYRYSNGAMARNLGEGMYSTPLKRIKDRLRRYSAKFDRDFYSDAESKAYFSRDGDNNDGGDDDSDSDDELHMIEMVSARADSLNALSYRSHSSSASTEAVFSSNNVLGYPAVVVAAATTFDGNLRSNLNGHHSGWSLLLRAAEKKAKKRLFRRWYNTVRRRLQTMRSASIVAFRHASFGNMRVVNNPTFVLPNSSKGGGGGYDNSLPLIDHKRIVSRYFYIWNVAFIRRNLKKLSKVKEAIVEKDVELHAVAVDPSRLTTLRAALDASQAALSLDAEAVEMSNSAVSRLDDSISAAASSLNIFAKSIAMLEEEKETLTTTIQTILALNQKINDEKNERNEQTTPQTVKPHVKQPNNDKASNSNSNSNIKLGEAGDDDISHIRALGLISESSQLQLDLGKVGVGIAQMKKEGSYKTKQLTDLTESNINESRSEVENVLRIKTEVSKQLALKQELRQQLSERVEDVNELNSRILAHIKFKNERIAELDSLLAKQREEFEKKRQNFKILSRRPAELSLGGSRTGGGSDSASDGENSGGVGTFEMIGEGGWVEGGGKGVEGFNQAARSKGFPSKGESLNRETNAIVLSLENVTAFSSLSQIVSRDFQNSSASPYSQGGSSPESSSSDTSIGKENTLNVYFNSGLFEKSAARGILQVDVEREKEKEKVRGERGDVGRGEGEGDGEERRETATVPREKISLAKHHGSKVNIAATNERLDPEDLQLIEEELSLSRRLQARLLSSIPSNASTRYQNESDIDSTGGI